MNTPVPEVRCPDCGAPLTAGAAGGLCARCLLAGAAAATEPGAPHGTIPEQPAVAAAFPQLEVLELIGRGGMGAVFKVRQPKLNRHAALKILPQSLAGDPAFAGRFEQEAQLLARLSHPNITAVYDYGQAGEFFYLLMEFVDGVNLRKAMQASRFTPAQALAIVPRICDALQYAHEEGRAAPRHQTREHPARCKRDA
jgi:serine/threonine protein kinase